MKPSRAITAKLYWPGLIQQYVLLQIFSHLHPMDVLSLSRTTKALRSILLARHARRVWRSNLASVRALPACPPDLTEPEYASLAFDNWCQVSRRRKPPLCILTSSDHMPTSLV
ncbi:hypothetical protein CPB84DRAFT_1768713 [Gymnopilus junonius]|uniref:F-box domain-containing protein n=1 Tax=Gymnopilus junonius TaxID=109634 RepID=A0A9P5TRE7_GYMJU|nr:hypothetical protein CPB84DRAFT_1768713 [Gymnopilus junonius]